MGSGSITKWGPRFSEKMKPSERYDFDAQPIDMIDAIARVHDMDQAVDDFESYMELRFLPGDVKLLATLKNFREQVKSGKLTIDPFTGKAPSKETMHQVNLGIKFFGGVIGRKIGKLNIAGSVFGAMTKSEREYYDIEMKRAERDNALPKNDRNGSN